MDDDCTAQADAVLTSFRAKLSVYQYSASPVTSPRSSARTATGAGSEEAEMSNNGEELRSGGASKKRKGSRRSSDPDSDSASPAKIARGSRVGKGKLEHKETRKVCPVVYADLQPLPDHLGMELDGKCAFVVLQKDGNFDDLGLCLVMFCGIKSASCN